VAPLTVGSFSTTTDHPGLTTISNDSKDDMAYGFWTTQTIGALSIPRLEVTHIIGEGSTGIVYMGSWNGNPVAVNVAVDVEEWQRCYTLNPIEVWSRSQSQGWVKSDLASAYVLHPYVTICPNISEYRSLGRRRTRTRDSGKI
jgi:hypothetical protein